MHYHGEHHDDPQAGSGSQSIGRERDILELAWVFETSKPSPSDILQPTRPHHLILLIIQTVLFPSDKAILYMSLQCVGGSLIFKSPQ